MAEGKKVAIIIGGVGAGVVALFALTRKAEAHPGNIVLEDLIISPTEVYVGETVEISLIATNIGEEKATKEVVCEVV